MMYQAVFAILSVMTLASVFETDAKAISCHQCINAIGYDCAKIYDTTCNTNGSCTTSYCPGSFVNKTCNDEKIDIEQGCEMDKKTGCISCVCNDDFCNNELPTLACTNCSSDDGVDCTEGEKCLGLGCTLSWCTPVRAEKSGSTNTKTRVVKRCLAKQESNACWNSTEVVRGVQHQCTSCTCSDKFDGNRVTPKHVKDYHTYLATGEQAKARDGPLKCHHSKKGMCITKNGVCYSSSCPKTGIFSQGCDKGEIESDVCTEDKGCTKCKCNSSDFCNVIERSTPVPIKPIKCYSCKSNDENNCKTGVCTTQGSCQSMICDAPKGKLTMKGCVDEAPIADGCETGSQCVTCRCKSKDLCNDFNTFNSSMILSSSTPSTLAPTTPAPKTQPSPPTPFLMTPVMVTPAPKYECYVCSSVRNEDCKISKDCVACQYTYDHSTHEMSRFCVPFFGPYKMGCHQLERVTEEQCICKSHLCNVLKGDEQLKALEALGGGQSQSRVANVLGIAIGVLVFWLVA